MSKRWGGGTAVLDEPDNDDDDDDVATRWQCPKCRYGNLGRERCVQCGAKVPADIRALGRDGVLVGAAEGFIVGGGLALLMAALLRLALGHPVLDPTAAVLAGDGALGPLVLGFLLIAVAAPVVEELVFRGFLAEALR